MLNPILLSINSFEDSRGTFYESYKKNFFKKEFGLDVTFLQDNHSISHKNVIRGLHYQWDKPMHKLVRVALGSIIDVIVDIRRESKNFGQVSYYELTSRNKKQLFVPAGFAHGFVSLTEETHVLYKCSEEYNKNGESGINPLDKDLKIDWKIDIMHAIVSDKDTNSKSFQEYSLNPKF
jgi:dTDP-4-dehydrorhamnose 3,5-epimerase